MDAGMRKCLVPYGLLKVESDVLRYKQSTKKYGTFSKWINFIQRLSNMLRGEILLF